MGLHIAIGPSSALETAEFIRHFPSSESFFETLSKIRHTYTMRFEEILSALGCDVSWSDDKKKRYLKCLSEYLLAYRSWNFNAESSTFEEFNEYSKNYNLLCRIHSAI